MDSSGGGSGRGQGSDEMNRMQGNLNQILQFAIRNTPTDREPEQREPLTEERRDFLEKVFTDMLRDEVKEMKEHLTVLKDIMGSEKEEDEQKKEEHLEALLDLCETIDRAQDFHKVGGTDVVMPLCNDPSSEVRWRALDLLANVLQNNPYNQQVMLNRDALKTFLNLLDKDESNQVRIKALYAVSCLIRENDAAQDVLVKEDGFSFLMRAMQTDVEKLQIKASFLLNALLWEQPKFNDTLHDIGMVQQLIHLLQGEHRMYHEHIMSAVVQLVERHEGCRRDSLQPELGFREFLVERSKELTGKEEYMEELEHCQKLLALYSKDSQQEDQSGADR